MSTRFVIQYYSSNHTSTWLTHLIILLLQWSIYYQLEVEQRWCMLWEFCARCSLQPLLSFAIMMWKDLAAQGPRLLVRLNCDVLYWSLEIWCTILKNFYGVTCWFDLLHIWVEVIVDRSHGVIRNSIDGFISIWLEILAGFWNFFTKRS